MKNKILRLTAGALATVSCLAPALSAADGEGKQRQYEVTITNLTRGQVLTPALAVTHNHNYHLFALGMPASPGLVTMAETGFPGDAAMEAAANGGVRATTTDTDVIPPGGSRTLMVESRAASAASGEIVPQNAS